MKLQKNTTMKNLVHTAVITLFAASAAQAQQAVQWKVSDAGNGHWYQLTVAGPISWHTAKVATESRGGHLATLTSDPEKRFVQSVVSATPGFGESAVRRWGPWLGGKQDRSGSDYSEPRGGWRWVTGEPWSYAAWPSYQPDNWCAETQAEEDFLTFAGYFLQSDGAWNDLPANGCDNDPVNSYVIEWSADCNNDGIVDYGQILQGQFADANTDGIPDTCQCGTIPSLPTCCPGDLDHDGEVGGADIGLLLSNWGPCDSACLYDLNNDDKVNGGDLGLLLSGWGPCGN